MSNCSSLRDCSTFLVITSVLLVGVAGSAAAVNRADIFEDAVFRSIAAQLSRMGVEESSLPVAGQLEILTTPAKDCLNPSIQDLYWDSLRNTLYFRMTCGGPKACAPFLVRAHVPSVKADLLRQRFYPDRRIARAVSANPNRCLQQSLLVRAGRPATLLLRGANMRLTTPVTALECGSAGQRVRARAKKTNRLFEAEVIGENLLAARF